MPGCVDDETIAAYVDGTLDVDEILQIDQHIDSCQRCRTQLSAVAAVPVMHSYVSDQEPAPAAELVEAIARGGAGDVIPGLAIGRYIVEQIIGRGGMGVVVRARDPELDRPVAIKLVDPWTAAHSASRGWRARLRDEARAMARLRHPNVVTVYDVGVVGNQLFVAMELVEGESLARHVEHDRKRAVALCIAAGRGLCAAHDAGLAHGDVKPDNILVDRDGRALIGDFGLTRTIDEGDGARGVIGTPGYMAPELLRRQPADAQTDQFALAVTVYEACTGRRPWHASSLDDLLRAIETEPPVRPPAMSRSVWRVVARGLSPDPKARFGSLAGFVDALERAQRRVPRGLIWAGAAAIAAGSVAVVALTREASPACADPIDRTRVLTSTTLCGPAPTQPCAALARDLGERAATWRTTHVGVCRATQQGRQSAVLLDRRMHCLDRRLDEHEALLGRLTTPIANADAFDTRAALQRIDSPESCATLDRAEQPIPADKAAAIADAEHRVAAARADFALGRYAAGRDNFAPHFDAIRALGHAPLVARAANVFGQLQMQVGELDAAEASFDIGLGAAAGAGHDATLAELLLLRAYLLGDARQQWSRGAELLRAAEGAIVRAGRPPELEARLLVVRGMMAEDTGKLADAHAQYTQALALHRRSTRFADVATTLQRVCDVERELGKLEDARRHCTEALQLLRERLGDVHPLIAEAQTNLGVAVAVAGDLAAARGHWEAALATLERGLGDDAPALAAVLLNLADVTRALDDPAAADRHLTRALQVTANAASSPTHIDVRIRVANQLRTNNRASEGLAMLEDLARRAEATFGPHHATTAHAFEDLGGAYYEDGKYAEARAAYEKTLAASKALYGPNHPTTLAGEGRYGQAMMMMKDAKSARPVFEHAMLALEETSRPDSSLLAQAYTNYADALTALGEATRAVEPARKGLAIREQRGDDPLQTSEARFVLAQAMWSAGRPGAVAIARKARDEMRAIGPAATTLPDLERWLAGKR